MLFYDGTYRLLKNLFIGYNAINKRSVDPRDVSAQHGVLMSVLDNTLLTMRS